MTLRTKKVFTYQIICRDMCFIYKNTETCMSEIYVIARGV
jgi:hypothetical protein